MPVLRLSICGQGRPCCPRGTLQPASRRHGRSSATSIQDVGAYTSLRRTADQPAPRSCCLRRLSPHSARLEAHPAARHPARSGRAAPRVRAPVAPQGDAGGCRDQGGARRGGDLRKAGPESLGHREKGQCLRLLFVPNSVHGRAAGRLEVAFIVLTFGTTDGNIALAVIAAGAASAVVVAVGVAVRVPPTLPSPTKHAEVCSRPTPDDLRPLLWC
jgi:hypothetical protein